MAEAPKPYSPPIELLVARFIYDTVLAAAEAATASSVAAVGDGSLTVQHVKSDTVAQTALVLTRNALRGAVLEEIVATEDNVRLSSEQKADVLVALKELLPR